MRHDANGDDSASVHKYPKSTVDQEEKAELNCEGTAAPVHSAHNVLSCNSSSLHLQDKQEVYCEYFLQHHPETNVNGAEQLLAVTKTS